MNTRGNTAHYFKSLNRPILIFGVDRSLFFLSCGLGLPVAFSAHLAPVMDIIAATMFFVCYVMSLIITKIDSQIIILYRRHIRYHRYYTAQPTLNALLILPNASVPAISKRD
jgi:type IV secretory pathway TrbD component